MTRRAGFTVVELILTITIMAILMTVAVVGLRGTQANARDEERKADVTMIARSLETFYTSGQANFTTTGRYPGANYLTSSTIATVMPDIDQAALRAPGMTTISLIKATNATATTTGVAPQPTKDTYVYQPLAYNSGTFTLCADHTTTECRKFNLFYKLETDSAVQMITSKNQ